MKSGATESSFYYLSQHYTFPENVDVQRTTHEIVKSNKKYKIIWAHDNCDQMGHRDLPQHVDKIDGIVCVSNWEREQFIKYNRAPAEKLHVIPNGVHEMFLPSGKPKSKTCIFFSAPHKGVASLVPIWKEVIKYHPDAKLKVFSSMSLYGDIQPGEGENETITGPNGLEPSPFISVYKELKELPGVEYSPCIDREELLLHIQDAAFYIHPNVWEETFCVSLAEAMSCGCFPITTDMGALPETSNRMGKYIPMSGKNTPRGWIPDKTFYKNFAEEVIRALHFFDIARDEYDQVSSFISNYAIENYNWTRVAELWEVFINNITNTVNIFGNSNIKTLEEFYEWSSNVNMVPAQHIDYLYRLKYDHKFEPKVVYDLGSAVLHWSKFARCVWRDAEFYHVDGFNGYKNLYDSNKINYVIEVLSNKDNQEKIFYENLKSVGSCSYYEMNYKEFPYNLEFKDSFYRERKVKTKTLDTLIEEKNWKLPDIIKMDIQGCELDVLKGAKKALQNCNHLILELQSKEYMKNAPLKEEVISYLEREGYTLVSHFVQNPSGADGDYHFLKNNSKDSCNKIIQEGTTCTSGINVCFALIPSRFKNIEKIIESFQTQTLNPDKIIITVPEKYHRFPYQKQEIESICNKYQNLIHLLYVDEDYGPATKIYGALKSLELYPNSNVVVCDDDAIYDERLLECYSKALQTNNTCVWTTDKDKDNKHAQYKQSYGVNGNYLVLPHHNIPKLQGVDTYIFTPNILEKLNSNNFKKYYIDFLQKNTNKKSLNDVFLHDDYFISILLYDLKIPVGFFYLKYPIYDILKSDKQIHESLKCHSDEIQMIQKIYQNYENLKANIDCKFTKVDGEKVGIFVIDDELDVDKYHEYIIDVNDRYGPFKIEIEIKK